MGKKIKVLHGGCFNCLQKLREYEESCSFTCLGVEHFNMGFIVLV